MDPRDFSYGDLLERNARVHRSRLAFAGPTGECTHGEWHARCVRRAGSLAAAGVRQGDRIAVLAHNRPEVLELLGAAAWAGAFLVLLNARGSPAETAAVVEDAAPALLFAEAALEPLLADVPAGVAGYSFGAAAARLRAWDDFAACTAEVAAVRVEACAPLAGIPTAAVEGRPRIALLSHAALLHQSLQLAHAWALGPADRHLCILPLYHTAGLGMVLAAQLAGGASWLMPRFDAAAAVQAVEAFRVSCFATFAPILGAVLDAAGASGAALASLRAVTGLEPPATVARLHERCPAATFWSAYGQTETAGLVSLAPAREQPGSSGRPLPSVALRIDATPPGAAGEILVRGPCVFSGYWQRPGESAHAARGGWHHTGDRGRLDEAGYLWFEGRAPEKALIKSGGENIYPAEVEQALLAHPGVAAAVVFGVPDERWGEAVRAVCVRQPGAAVGAAELAEFVGSRIARFKRPREVVFTEALPRAAEGSWDREAIRAMYGG